MSNTSSLLDAPTIGDVRAELAGVLARASAVLERLEPAELPTSLTPRLLGQFVALERLGAAGRVLLTAKAVEAERWKRDGFKTPAEWLAAQQGCSTGKARDDLGTSRLVGNLPETADALRHGTLSPAQASAIADASATNPEAEADLLELARRESLKRLKDEAARRKAQREDQDDKHRRFHRERKARSWVGRDGKWHLHAEGPATAGAGFETDWQRLTSQQFGTARRQGRHETHDNYAFDALIAMASLATTSGPVDNTSDLAPLPRAENVRHLALLHLDLEALTRGHTLDGERCEIAGLGPISVDAARELLGESIVKLVITRGVDVAHITHLGRGPTVAQQIALLWSSPRCTVEGCNRTARLQNDHRIPWAEDRVTRLANLDPLCTHDHDKKTLHGWALIDGTGRRPMVPPDHPDHPRNRGGP